MLDVRTKCHYRVLCLPASDRSYNTGMLIPSWRASLAWRKLHHKLKYQDYRDKYAITMSYMNPHTKRISKDHELISFSEKNYACNKSHISNKDDIRRFHLKRPTLTLFCRSPPGPIREIEGFVTHICVTREMRAVFQDAYMRHQAKMS